MASAVHPAMIMAPPYQQSNACIDPESEFIDFSQLASPTSANLKRETSAHSTFHSPTSNNIDDDLQTPAKPSHEYGRFKQQTGLPSGSIVGLPAYNPGFAFSSSGIDDMTMMSDPTIMNGGWNTGLPMDSNMNMGGMDFQRSSFMYTNENMQDDFCDPSSIEAMEEAPQVRVWPGMHQKNALAKKQAQAQYHQQRQQSADMAHRQAQVAAQQSAAHHPGRPQQAQVGRKLSSPLSDARTEETIARVVAQIRADSQSATSAMGDGRNDLLPHIIRAKKDEEDMDEDERLLASEAGKKLTSKERRQLRNKVSARAFRSRRKGKLTHHDSMISTDTTQNTSSNSKAKFPSRSKKPTPYTPRTPSSRRRTPARAHSSSVSFATKLSPPTSRNFRTTRPSSPRPPPCSPCLRARHRHPPPRHFPRNSSSRRTPTSA
jgi:hypothetical protein